MNNENKKLISIEFKSIWEIIFFAIMAIVLIIALIFFIIKPSANTNQKKLPETTTEELIKI
jgi:hypothetical protein